MNTLFEDKEKIVAVAIEMYSYWKIYYPDAGEDDFMDYLDLCIGKNNTGSILEPLMEEELPGEGKSKFLVLRTIYKK